MAFLWTEVKKKKVDDKREPTKREVGGLKTKKKKQKNMKGWVVNLSLLTVSGSFCVGLCDEPSSVALMHSDCLHHSL